MSFETIEVLLANRSFMYALMARGFAEEPDGAFVEVLAGEHARQHVALLESQSGDALSDAFAALVDRATSPGAIARLSREYVRVFVGPGTLKAPAFETVQLTGKRALFQPGVLSVRESYRKAGFLPAAYRSVPDDFVGIEFDFMAKLADQAFRAWASGDAEGARNALEQAEAFSRDHLANWVGLLADAMEEGYGDCFYTEFTRFAALVVAAAEKLCLSSRVGGVCTYN